jgi:hypothetical protein
VQHGKKSEKNSVGKTLRDQFAAGLLIIVPLGASILINIDMDIQFHR